MLEIFQYDFMIRAFVAGLLIAILSPLIGMFLVVRRYSSMADTLAHVSLVGVAIGALFEKSPVIFAIIVSVIASLLIETLRENKKLFGESILALFLSGSLALAVVLMSFSSGFQGDLFSFLFGSITTVSWNEVILISVLFVVLSVCVMLFHKKLFLFSFHEELAFAEGVKTRVLGKCLLVSAAVVIALSMRIVGTLLIGALMVIPVVTAMQWRVGFWRTLFLAIIFSLLSMILGLFVSFYIDIPTGGTVVLVSLLFFFISLLSSRT